MLMSFPNVNEQLDLITKNIDELLPADELEKKL